MYESIPQTLNRDQLYELVHSNLDARRYFYHKADERWLGWLWENGFLDVLKEEDTALDGFRTPELGYLRRMVKKCPAQVVDIMLEIPVATDARSEEVVYGFLGICGALPAAQLARVVGRIRDERWIQLLDAIYYQSGLEYGALLDTLADANDFGSFLTLADAVLAVHPGEESDGAFRYRDNPFYLEYLPRTKIFERLAAVDAGYAERALALATSKLAEIMAASDQFLLLDVDFFTLEPGQTDSWVGEEGARELTAAAKRLAVRLIGDRCADAADVRRIYREHLASRPDSRVMRRLRLFVLSLCPQAFREELKQAFFSLFEEENYHDQREGYYFVMSGAEYLKALRAGFSVLSARDKRDYVQRTLATFKQPNDIKYFGYLGSRSLSMILPYLNENPALKKEAEEAGYQLDPHYEPRPSINWEDGALKPITQRAPITQEEFGKLPIVEIADRLRRGWTPTELNAKNSAADFYNPLSAEGVGDLLKEDIAARLPEYVEHAGLFFERGALDQHYTYGFLAGIQETIKNHRGAASEANWDGVIDLFVGIKDSDAKEPFERGRRESGWFDFWLANWDAVHSAAADVLRELLTERDGQAPVDFGRYRDRILSILGYLLTSPEPLHEEKQGETGQVQAVSSGDREYSVRDLHSLAINSMRGRAFEAFVSFVYQDGKNPESDAAKQISDDVRSLYERVLRKETARALMFLFGRYLPSFYFRDRDWIRQLLPNLFPQKPAKQHLHTAAWGGFLSRNLYEEMFFDPEVQNLYLRSFELPDTVDSLRQNDGEPGARLAQHLALAFMHYEEFGLDHALLETFWEKGYPNQHAHFVRFLGRSFVSGGRPDQFFLDHPDSKPRLGDLWEWALKREEKPEVYREFGLWVNLDKGIFEPAWLARQVRQTLERTGGVLGWDVGLQKAGPRLAQEAAEETLEIARLYLLEGVIRGGNQELRWLWDSDNTWMEVFETLHGNAKTRAETVILINRLIEDGGRAFWPLKRILRRTG